MELDSLRSSLESTLDPAIRESSRIMSAVLVIISDAVDPSVIMTVKPQSMRQHAGQVAFPGGKVEPQDGDLLDTALRESNEELGVRIGRTEVIGQMDAVFTQSSGYEIVPFVCIRAETSELVPNAEVDKILAPSLEDIFSSSGTSPDLGRVFLHGGYTIWGATARILEDIGRRTGLWAPL